MTTLKVQQQQQRRRSRAIPLRVSDQQVGQKQDELVELFPRPRYFQVHFQHVHESAQELHQEVDQLKHHIVSLEAKVDALLSLLINMTQDTHLHH